MTSLENVKNTSPLSQNGKFISCPFCFDFFDHERLVCIHVICKHPEDYYDLICTANVDDICEKIPGIRGSVLEASMRKREKENVESKQLLPSTQTQAKEDIPRQKECTPTIFNVVPETATTIPTSTTFYSDLNLDINENEASVASSPCILLSSGPQSVDDACNERTTAISDLYSFVNQIGKPFVTAVGNSSLCHDGTFDSATFPTFGCVDDVADSSMPILFNANTSSPIAQPAKPQSSSQQNLLEGNLSQSPNLLMYVVSSPNNLMQTPTLFQHQNVPDSNMSCYSSYSTAPTIQKSSPIVVATTPPIKQRQQRKKKNVESRNDDVLNNKRSKQDNCGLYEVNVAKLEINYGASTRIIYRSEVVCLSCLKTFPSAEDVIQHEWQSHQDLVRYFCPHAENNLNVCSFRFTRPDQINGHMHSYHHNGGQWLMRCCWCSTIFDRYMKFYEHIQNEYRERRLTLIRETIHQQIKVTCTKCKTTFFKKEDWFNHRADACYANEPEAERNRRLATEERNLTRFANNRNGCVHNKQLCAYYPMCEYLDRCSYAHPICPDEMNCRATNCINDHSNRRKNCSLCPSLNHSVIIPH